jgi:predicted dehydrogenase
MFRRNFLMAAGGAAAAPAAGGRVRIALLGTQHVHAGGKLKALLDSPDYEVAGVCEPDASLRRQRQGEAAYRGQRWLAEEELLSDRSISVAAVETAVWDFMAFGRKVIAAGKHLHLEKPPTAKMAEFRELVEEARRKKLLLQTGYIWRFHAGFAAAMDAARQGWLGDVYMLRGTINTDIDDTSRAGVGRYAGGMMYELGCHMIDRVVDLWGRPKDVKSWLRHDTRTPDKLADNTLAVLEYEKSLAVISTSARMPGSSQHRSFELIGTEGAIVIQPIEPGTRMRVSMREARGPYRPGWQDIEMASQPRYVGDFRDLARAIKSGTPLKYSYDYELVVEETVLRASGEMS